MANSNSVKPRRGRPVNPQLREDIIRVAGDLFSELGLHATKMEHIAAELKISKLTLYSRFKDKEELFAAVVQRKCREFVPDQPFLVLDAVDARTSLNQICLSLMQLLTSDAAMGMERMLMALENSEREKLTRLFYREGPERVIRLIHDHLNGLNQQAKLKVRDPLFAANVLAAMIKGADLCTRKQMHVTPPPTTEEMQNYCSSVVDLFIRSLD